MDLLKRFYRYFLNRHLIIASIILVVIAATWFILHNRSTEKTSSAILLVPPTFGKSANDLALRKTLLYNVRETDVFFYTDINYLSYRLLANNRIRSSFLFRTFGELFNITEKLKPGIYPIPGGLSCQKLAKFIADASPASNFLVLTPGDTLIDIQNKFENMTFKTSHVKGQKIMFSNALKTINTYYQIEIMSPEGFFYPGVYFFNEFMSLDEILSLSVHSFHNEFGKYLTESGDASKIIQTNILPFLKKHGVSIGQTNSSIAVPSLELLTSFL